MKRHMNNRIWLLIAIVLLLAGCVGTWTRVDDSTKEFKTNNYQVLLPMGWVLITLNDAVFVTRDGIGIQQIEVLYRPHDKAFEKLKKSSSAEMLPEELAELYIGETKANYANGLPSLKVITNEPTEIDGHQGFYLHLKYTADNGLHHESLVNGFANQKGLYVIRYIAPSLHFFSTYKGAYQNVVSSFKAS